MVAEAVLTVFSGWFARALLASVGGLLLALGHAPFSLPWVAMVGLLAIFIAVAASISPRQAAWSGWVAGTTYFALHLQWIVEPFQVDVARHGWMAPFALAFLAGGLALFWALAGWTARRFAADHTGPIVFALLLSLVELARSVVLTGFPWGLIAGIWINSPAAAWLSWVGPHGLTFVTLLGPAMLVALALSSKPARAVIGIAVPAALIGAGMMQTPAPNVAQNAPIVRLVQPNAPQHLKWHPDWTRVFMNASWT